MTESDVLFDIIRGRRSIRRFLEKPVPAELLERLMEAACWAPSASNRQDWFFTVVTSVSTKRKMAQAVRARWRR